MDLLTEVEKLGSTDTAAAERAMERLRVSVERFLERYLRSWLPNQHDREDVIALTLQRIWSRRSAFQARGIGAWWVYVSTIARRCAIDIKETRTLVPLEEEISADEEAAIDAVYSVAAERAALYRAADELWLGRAPNLDESHYRKRLLAAQLFFLDRLTWPEVADVLGLGSEARSTLDTWFGEKACGLGLGYREIFSDSRTLTRSLLESATWTEDEANVVRWRYENGFLTEKILQLSPQMTREDVEAILRRSAAHLPFLAKAHRLREALGRQPHAIAGLAAPDLWKRLVFQYHAESEFPHLQILERTQPSAEVFGYRLTGGILNVWLSNGRLASQLARYVQTQQAT